MDCSVKSSLGYLLLKFLKGLNTAVEVHWLSLHLQMIVGGSSFCISLYKDVFHYHYSQS
jgi:hypothetical protein